MIATDTFSVLQVLQRQRLQNIRHHIIGQIRQKIVATYKRVYDIKIIWIPAHVGILDNEKADKSAKSACLLTNIQEPNIEVPTDWFSNHKLQEREKFYIALCEYGSQNRLKGENYMKYIKSFHNTAWYHNKKLSRRDITYINRIRSGHYQLNAHLYKIKIVGDPKCEC